MVTLSTLADRVADEFKEYRDPNALKDVTLVIDDGTLIVHTSDGELADQVDEFLRSQGAVTEREWYDKDDIRVLAVV